MIAEGANRAHLEPVGMWPWGHLAIGYLLYSTLVHVLARRPPDDRATIALALGTQFPDLVDKPLAWTLGVIPNGRSLTHSLLVAIVVVAIFQWLARRYDANLEATAFSVGYLSHLVGDALYPALSGDFYSLQFLVWPVLPPVVYPSEGGFLAHLQNLTLSSVVVVELAFGVVVFLIWLADGTPGLGVVVAIPRWVGRRLTA